MKDFHPKAWNKLSWGEVMEKIGITAHAKINLTLDVTNRRTDGYHSIRSVMQSLRLADNIHLTKLTQGIQLHCGDLVPQNSSNLAYRAAQMFFEHTKISGGVKISLAKYIPVAAGLAGGSADAAAVIAGLNELYGTALSLKEQQIIGQTLGADIPFCLQGGTVLAEGIGDELSPLPDLSEHNWWVVLLKPEFGVSTKEVYQGLDPTWFEDKFTSPLVADLWNKNQSCKSLEFGGNLLERVTIEHFPQIKQLKTELANAGAMLSLMSGSGPTVFGIFAREEQARQFRTKYTGTQSIVTQFWPRGLDFI